MNVKIIPTLRYRDPQTAIDWLTEILGFSAEMVMEDEDGAIAHAELSFDGSMIMLGAVRDDAFGETQVTPDEAGGVTQSAYIIVQNPDALYERVVASGAEVVFPLHDKPYGSREFSCRDFEGHLWNFGTYNPFVS
ncbi:hypothetical protein FPY71_16430 [Aureimonas fodinaquatilis]|uniref:VOC domain-containing protein n=1 Tax=Aureimonas fodinaquatilis TaxID=2565783 RepID=A0A5B0DPV3_9HYPH|nr:VOC family protein [Aureimonas fodinaquatilis]KAA0968478.1 hypothetical protein FPY71_16430 [Aureimonas fodinaquatilis]